LESNRRRHIRVLPFDQRAENAGSSNSIPNIINHIIVIELLKWIGGKIKEKSMKKETLQKLKLFTERVERLRSNEDFFKNVKLNLSFEKGVGAKTTLQGPDPKTIKAALLDFRPFTLNDEPANFNYICNLIEKEVEDEDLRNKARQTRDVWNKLFQRKQRDKAVGGLKMQIDSKVILSEENFNIWMNTDYFHLGDSNERELLKRMEQTPFGQLSHFAFIDLIQRLSGILFWFDKEVVVPVLAKDE
jgi:hypothetical protein